MKVKEIIVVEGKNDTNTLKSFIECDTIETHGTCLSKYTLAYIKKMQEIRGVIIFTDPDFPGNKIRSIINEAIPGCKNAFLARELAQGKNKIGIEHAEKKDIVQALNNHMTYQDSLQTLSLEQYMDLGLTGKNDSSIKRDYICKKLFIGHANAKSMYKRLNMIGCTKEQLEEILRNMND